MFHKLPFEGLAFTGFLTSSRGDLADMSDEKMELGARALMEDKTMIEAQQCLIDRHAPRVVPTVHDTRGQPLSAGVECMAREEVLMLSLERF